MGAKIVICHYAESGHWNALEIPSDALNGHDGHDMDIWPPVPEVTDGMNWPRGEAVYLNGCVLDATATPSPSPSPTLPESGFATALVVIASILMVLIGMVILRISSRPPPDDRG